MKNFVNSISEFILILTISAAFANYTFDCSEYETPIVLKTHFCEIKTHTAFNEISGLLVAALPFPSANDEFKNAEIIIIRPPCENFTFLINDTKNFFALFPGVRSLSIGGFRNFSFSEDLANKQTELVADLFDLPALDNLSITDAQLDNAYEWNLPENLLNLNFSGNRYTKYNLENVTHLQVVDFSRNNLTEIPLMKYPLRSLSELYLHDNPLNDVKVEHIARFCTLKKLTLSGSSFELPTEERFCECQKLKRWIQTVRKWMKEEYSDEEFVVNSTNFGGSLQCRSPQENTDCKVIMGSKWSLYESFAVREQCLSGKYFTPEGVDEVVDEVERFNYIDDNNFTMTVDKHVNATEYGPISFRENSKLRRFMKF